MAFFVPGLPFGSLETARVGTPETLWDYNFMFRPPIEMRSEARQELSNSLSHATYTHGSRVNS
jgi:hypothetical protein